jgi:hypothetical protein
VLMCVTLLACCNDMVISIFIICNLLKSWNYLLFLCDEVRLFMPFSGMLSGTGYPSGRTVEFTRRVRVWNYFPTRVHSRVTRRVKFSPNGYGWALPIGYVPVAIVTYEWWCRSTASSNNSGRTYSSGAAITAKNIIE